MNGFRFLGTLRAFSSCISFRFSSMNSPTSDPTGSFARGVRLGSEDMPECWSAEAFYDPLNWGKGSPQKDFWPLTEVTDQG